MQVFLTQRERTTHPKRVFRVNCENRAGQQSSQNVLRTISLTISFEAPEKGLNNCFVKCLVPKIKAANSVK